MSITPEALKEYLQQPDGPHKVILRRGAFAEAAWTGLEDRPIAIRYKRGFITTLKKDGGYYANPDIADEDDIVGIPPEPPIRRWVYLNGDGTYNQMYFTENCPDLGIKCRWVLMECTPVNDEDTQS